MMTACGARRRERGKSTPMPDVQRLVFSFSQQTAIDTDHEAHYNRDSPRGCG